MWENSPEFQVSGFLLYWQPKTQTGQLVSLKSQPRPILIFNILVQHPDPDSQTHTHNQTLKNLPTGTGRNSQSMANSHHRPAETLEIIPNYFLLTKTILFLVFLTTNTYFHDILQPQTLILLNWTLKISLKTLIWLTGSLRAASAWLVQPWPDFSDLFSYFSQHKHLPSLLHFCTNSAQLETKPETNKTTAQSLTYPYSANHLLSHSNLADSPMVLTLTSFPSLFGLTYWILILLLFLLKHQL